METPGRPAVLPHVKSGSGLFSTSVFADASERAARRDTQQSAASSSSRRTLARRSGRPSARYSHSSSTRGSARGVRGGGGGQALDSAGQPSDRILCIDEEGRDRTPKPLLPPRRHAQHLASRGWDGEGAGGSAAAVSRTMQEQALSQLAGIPSAGSWLASEATEASLDGAGLPPGRQSALGHSGRPSVHGALASAEPASAALRPAEALAASAAGAHPGLQGEADGFADATGTAWPPTGAISEVGPAEQLLAQAQLAAATAANGPSHQQQRRARPKAGQQQAVACASVAVQVLPWELRGGGGGGGGLPQPTQGEGEGEGVADDVDDEEAALLVLQQVGAGDEGGDAGERRRRGSPTPYYRSGASSRYSSRRGSMAGLHRMSSLNSSVDDWSRPTTGAASSRRTSVAVSDWGGRESLAGVRSSLAAVGGADGRRSLVGGAAGFHPAGGSASGSRPQTGRSSIMSAGQGQGRRGTGAAGGGSAVAAAAAVPPPPRPSPEQLAAAAARRQAAQRERALARMPGLLGSLRVAERVVLLNARHSQLAQYQGVQLCRAQEPGTSSIGPDGASTADDAAAQQAAAAAPPSPQRPGSGLLANHTDGAASPPPPLGGLGAGQPAARLPLLWAWGSALAGGLPVSCLAWSKAAPGLLAVGYGALQYGVVNRGLVAVWSLAHPSHPVWHAATTCGVSALDWSAKAAGTLALGFFDGGIAVHEVAGGGAAPLAAAPGGGAGGGHAEPVWQLQYVPRGDDPGGELLASVSSDGRVLEWKHTQGLEPAELLHLQRPPRGGGAALEQDAGGGGGLLGCAAGGTCLAFSTADPRTYLVGTEAGALHKCSTAFSEQPTQSYLGHLAPVYQVCWSPFSPSHFLTASADCSVRLWHEAQAHSLCTFQLLGAPAEVADVAFNPASATLFAAAAGGSLQLWDVARSVLAPAAVAAAPPRVRLTAVAFSQAAPVLVAGADDGSVLVFGLAGVAAEAADSDAGRQQHRLEAALAAHVQHIAD